MCHIFFIHSSDYGHLGCFHVLAIVNRAAMNILAHDSFWIMVFSGYMPSSGIAGSCGSSIFSFFFFEHLYWGIIALQWCVSFSFITKWISYTYTYVPISFPSCISLPPTLPIPHPRWSQSTELITLCYAVASRWLSILRLVVYICPCLSLTLSQLTLPPPHILKSIL